MNYYIVTLIKLVNTEVYNQPIGYITDYDIVTKINLKYESTFETWVNNNKDNLTSGAVTLSEFFSITPMVYGVFQQTTSVEGMKLIDISDLI